MIEIRIHGRGGQGAQVASHILARAASKEGKYSQAFAVFGGERRGAPVLAYVRISDKAILLRCQVYEPGYVLVLDPALPKIVNVGAGLKENGWLIINSKEVPEAVKVSPSTKVKVFDGSNIAAKHGLGTAGMPIVNTVMLGAFCGATNIVRLEMLLEAVREYVPTKVEGNLSACEEAYRLAKES